MAKVDLTKWDSDDGPRFAVGVELELHLDPGGFEGQNDDREFDLNVRGTPEDAWNKVLETVMDTSLRDLIFDWGLDFGAVLTVELVDYHDGMHPGRPKYVKTFRQQRYWWSGHDWVRGQ